MRTLVRPFLPFRFKTAASVAVFFSLVLVVQFYSRPPVLQIRGADKSRCCRAGNDAGNDAGVDGGEDVCGRRPCSVCPSTVVDRVGGRFASGDSDSNVFFVETSEASSLNIRQACSVESVARNNPNHQIHMLMSAPVNDSAPTTLALARYSNVHLHYVQPGEYFVGTVLDEWYFCSDWNHGAYAVAHLSDAIRYLVLFKYGGYYFDLDFIMTKPLGGLRRFVGAESDQYLAIAAMHHEAFHPVVQMMLEEFRDTYRRNDWGYNGPQLLTRVFHRWCRAQEFASMFQHCNDYQILPPEIFYPVPWMDWKRLFSDQGPIVEFHQSIAVHFHNHLSGATEIRKNSKQIFTQLAQLHCPNVYDVAGETF